jgi:hypothetical protein
MKHFFFWGLRPPVRAPRSHVPLYDARNTTRVASSGLRPCGIPIGAWLVVFAAFACTSASPGFDSTELEEYCAVATRPDLVSWVGDVVTLCEQGEMDHHGTCSAGRVIGGEVEPIELDEGVAIQLALPASNGRLILLLEDERLVLANDSGQIERELDRWAADPSVSSTGERVAWIGVPDAIDLAEVGLGTPKVVAVMSLSDAERTVLVEDPMASAPRPVPGSAEVLYVSGNEDGVASFFLAGPERGATQITNLLSVDDGADFDPVAGSPATWSSGALLFSVSGLESVEEVIDDPDADDLPEDDEENGEVVDDIELDLSHLFRLVLAEDEARVEEIGEGAWPQVTRDGVVLAAYPGGSAPCATTYTLEGTP